MRQSALSSLLVLAAACSAVTACASASSPGGPAPGFLPLYVAGEGDGPSFPPPPEQGPAAPAGDAAGGTAKSVPVFAFMWLDVGPGYFRGDLDSQGFDGGSDGMAWGGAARLGAELRAGNASFWFDIRGVSVDDDLGLEDSVVPSIPGETDVSHGFGATDIGAGWRFLSAPFDPDWVMPRKSASGVSGLGPVLKGPRQQSGLDVVGGVRFFSHVMLVEVDTGNEDLFGDESESWCEPFAGLRGEWHPNGDWIFRASGTAGGLTGNSGFTWRVLLEAAFRLGPNAWIRAAVDVQRLDYHQGDGDPARFRVEGDMGAITLGAEFWF